MYLPRCQCFSDIADQYNKNTDRATEWAGSSYLEVKASWTTQTLQTASIPRDPRPLHMRAQGRVQYHVAMLFLDTSLVGLGS